MEIRKNWVCAKFAHTANYCKTYNIEFYNLDAIISVEYRVKQDQQYISTMDEMYKKYLE